MKVLKAERLGRNQEAGNESAGLGSRAWGEPELEKGLKMTCRERDGGWLVSWASMLLAAMGKLERLGSVGGWAQTLSPGDGILSSQWPPGKSYTAKSGLEGEERRKKFSSFFFFFLRQSLALSPGWSAVAPSRLTATSASWVVILLPQASQVAGTKSICHHAQLIFVFLEEIGFHYVDQDGLDLLTSRSAHLSPQSAGITGVRHRTSLVLSSE